MNICSSFTFLGFPWLQRNHFISSIQNVWSLYVINRFLFIALRFYDQVLLFGWTRLVTSIDSKNIEILKLMRRLKFWSKDSEKQDTILVFPIFLSFQTPRRFYPCPIWTTIFSDQPKCMNKNRIVTNLFDRWAKTFCKTCRIDTKYHGLEKHLKVNYPHTIFYSKTGLMHLSIKFQEIFLGFKKACVRKFID